MHTLYFSPGACSLTVHIVLQELDIAHDLVRVSTGDEEHKRPRFLDINPLAQVPVVRTPDGERLTEVVSLLLYLAEQTDAPLLLPTDPLARQRCIQLMSQIATGLHPAYTMIIRPDRITDDEAAHAPLRIAGRARFARLLDHIAEQIPTDGPWLFGEQYTVADAYLFVMFGWAQYAGVDLSRWPRLRSWAARVRERPATLRALRAEELIDDAGRVTPPARV
jgi:glutathione S-transferase